MKYIKIVALLLTCGMLPAFLYAENGGYWYDSSEGAEKSPLNRTNTLDTVIADKTDLGEIADLARIDGMPSTGLVWSVSASGDGSIKTYNNSKTIVAEDVGAATIEKANELERVQIVANSDGTLATNKTTVLTKLSIPSVADNKAQVTIANDCTVWDDTKVGVERSSFAIRVSGGDEDLVSKDEHKWIVDSVFTELANPKVTLDNTTDGGLVKTKYVIASETIPSGVAKFMLTTYYGSSPRDLYATPSGWQKSGVGAYTKDVSSSGITGNSKYATLATSGSVSCQYDNTNPPHTATASAVSVLAYKPSYIWFSTNGALPSDISSIISSIDTDLSGATLNIGDSARVADTSSGVCGYPSVVHFLQGTSTGAMYVWFVVPSNEPIGAYTSNGINLLEKDGTSIKTYTVGSVTANGVDCKTYKAYRSANPFDGTTDFYIKNN